MEKFIRSIEALRRTVERIEEGKEVSSSSIEHYLDTCIENFKAQFDGFLGYERVLTTLLHARRANSQRDNVKVVQYLKLTKLLES